MYIGVKSFLRFFQLFFKFPPQMAENSDMDKEKDEKLERLLWDIFFKPGPFGEYDMDLLMQAWNVLEDSKPEDVLEVRARFIRTFSLK